MAVFVIRCNVGVGCIERYKAGCEVFDVLVAAEMVQLCKEVVVRVDWLDCSKSCCISW